MRLPKKSVLALALLLGACEPMGSTVGGTGGEGAAGSGGSGGSGGSAGSGGNPDGGSGPDAAQWPDAAPPPMGGTVGPSGGTVDRLAFMVFGDVRPDQEGLDQNYPSAIIGSIMQRAAATPAEFGLGTGDYMFAYTSASVSTQLGKLINAEAGFPKPIFHAMGNHECTGGTSSNCPNGTETANVRGYLMQLVPFTSTPYYALTIHTNLGDAKFVFLAANAWDSAQQSWLESQLSQATTYTFVIRHEPPGNTEAPGAAASDPILRAHPLTVGFFGHSHEYRHMGTNQVISGNAGAPISWGTYGFLYVVQRPDGNIQVEEHRQDTGAVSDWWVVTPSGTATR